MRDTAAIHADRAATHQMLRDACIAASATLDPAARQALLDQITVVTITLARGSHQAGFLARASAYRRIAREAIVHDPLSVDPRVSARLIACLGLVDIPHADLAVKAILESPHEED